MRGLIPANSKAEQPKSRLSRSRLTCRLLATRLKKYFARSLKLKECFPQARFSALRRHYWRLATKPPEIADPGYVHTLPLVNPSFRHSRKSHGPPTHLIFKSVWGSGVSKKPAAKNHKKATKKPKSPGEAWKTSDPRATFRKRCNLRPPIKDPLCFEFLLAF